MVSSEWIGKSMIETFVNGSGGISSGSGIISMVIGSHVCMMGARSAVVRA